MTLLEKMAKAAREAYAVHLGEAIVPWANADPEKREAWLACMAGALAAAGLDETGAIR